MLDATPSCSQNALLLPPPLNLSGQWSSKHQIIRRRFAANAARAQRARARASASQVTQPYSRPRGRTADCGQRTTLQIDHVVSTAATAPTAALCSTHTSNSVTQKTKCGKGGPLCMLPHLHTRALPGGGQKCSDGRGSDGGG